MKLNPYDHRLTSQQVKLLRLVLLRWKSNKAKIHYSNWIARNDKETLKLKVSDMIKRKNAIMLVGAFGIA
jgi:hypothetical protein